MGALLGAPFVVALLPEPAFAHDGTCDAKPWRVFVGQPLDRINPATLPEIFRVIYPDSTAEVEPDDDRLNIVVDETPTITDIFCG